MITDEEVFRLPGLAAFQAQANDCAKRWLELTCTDCGAMICDIEHADSFEVLARCALSHAANECRPRRLDERGSQ